MEIKFSFTKDMLTTESYSNVQSRGSTFTPESCTAGAERARVENDIPRHNVTAMIGVSGNRVIEMTIEDILERENAKEFHILIPSLILVCALMALGIPGNMIALLVYLTKMKRSTASYFIITLSLSDLLNCLVSLPIEICIICNFWTFDSPWLCKLSRFFSAAMNNTSSFILVAIAVERFRSICMPLKPRITSLRTKVICCALTSAASVLALPMIWGYGTFTYPYHSNNLTIYKKTCLIADEVRNTNFPKIVLIYFFVGHVIVFIILAVLYICIARKLICRSILDKVDISAENILLKRQNSAYSITSCSVSARNLLIDADLTPNLHRQLIQSTSSQSHIDFNLSRRHGGHIFRTKRLTCMLFLVTSVFEVSFIPYLVIASIRSTIPNFESHLSLTGLKTYQLFLRSYLINCAVNPIIYCFYNQNFRHGVKKLFYSLKEKFVFTIVNKK